MIINKYKCLNIDKQGRQTRQNSGGVADLTKGLFLKFLRDKNINFFRVSTLSD